MLSVPAARKRLLDQISPLAGEEVAVADAVGRVLVDEITARTSLPQVDRSAMDGYAIRAKDFGTGVPFRLIGALAAGAKNKLRVGKNQTARVLTGAPIPIGADTVIIQENAARHGNQVTFNGEVVRGQFIRKAKLDFAHGARLLRKNHRLGPMDTMLAAAGNWSTLPVRMQPRVSIVATGDELVRPGSTLHPNQVVASSGYGIAGLLTKQGAVVTLGPPVRDRAAAIRARLRQAARHSDLIVTLGGVSVGDRDLISNEIARAELETIFHGVAMRPGKPLLVGRYEGTLLVGLPGNPASAIVCTHVFLRPAINRFLGMRPETPRRHTAVLAVPLPAGKGREHYMRAIVNETNGLLECHPFNEQDSSIISHLSRANALAIQPARSPALPIGHPIEYLDISS